MAVRASLPHGDARYALPWHSVELILLTVEDGRIKVVMGRDRDYLQSAGLVLPGTLVIESKSYEEIIARLLTQKFGLENLLAMQVGTFSDPERVAGRRLVTTAYLAPVEAGRLHAALDCEPGYQLVEVNFHPVVHLSSLFIGQTRIEAGSDHELIIAMAVQYLRERLDHSLLGFQLVEETFTLLDLQKVHEAVLGEALNKPLFRKRMLARIFPRRRRLEKVPGMVVTGPHRPAAVFRLSDDIWE